MTIHAKADMRLDAQNLEGELENLSLKGAFVASGGQFGINDVVTLNINSTLACGIKAKVVRVTDKGLGLRFERTLLD
jgi:hypothetical protein